MSQRNYKRQNLQVLVTEDYNKFIIVNKVKNTSTIITPFEKIDDEYTSNFVLPENRTYRVSQMRSLIPKISKFTSYSDYVNLDCVEVFDSELFNGIDRGIVMMNIVSRNEKIKDTEDKYENILEGYQKILLRNCEGEFEKQIININNKFVFETKELKVLPVILYDGFILSITNSEKSILYLTLQNPKELLVGQCSKKNSFSVINFFYNIWPIFDINIRKKATVKLYFDNDDIVLDYENPVMLKLEKRLDSPETTIEVVGVSE